MSRMRRHYGRPSLRAGSLAAGLPAHAKPTSCLRAHLQRRPVPPHLSPHRRIQPQSQLRALALAVSHGPN